MVGMAQCLPTSLGYDTIFKIPYERSPPAMRTLNLLLMYKKHLLTALHHHDASGAALCHTQPGMQAEFLHRYAPNNR